MTTLTPGLEPLDEKVWAALRPDVGQRASRVAQLVHGSPRYRCDKCGDESSARTAPARDPLGWEARKPMRCIRLVRPRTDRHAAQWCVTGLRMPVLVTTPEQRQEVREVLRGLERVGKAYQASGWWRRA